MHLTSHIVPMPRTVLSFDVGIRNLAYCLARFDDTGRVQAVLSWNVVDVVTLAGSKAKTKGLGMNKTVDFMISALKHVYQLEWKEHGAVDSVVIEQQLSRASLLKVLQFTIYTFAKMTYPDAKVTLCHAKHKLQADMTPYGCTAIWQPKKRADRSRILKPTKKQLKNRETQKRYRDNKEKCTWMATKVIDYLVAQQPEEPDSSDDTAIGAAEDNPVENFNVSKKKDDLADCLIQAIVST